VAPGFYDPLDPSGVEEIHHSALRVLHEVGVQVESRDLLSLLADHGADVDMAEQRARFAPARVEQFVSDSEKYDWDGHQPSFGCYAGIYACLYLNPWTDQLEPFTEDTLRDYIRLANALPEVSGVSLLGLPFTPAGIPAAYTPLAEKLYAWEYGAEPAGTVQFTGLCPYLEDMYARRAQETGQSLEDCFGAVGYLVSPLRLARSECEQLLCFRSRGLRMHIGHMLSMGASAPVTTAGAAVLKLAESLFLGILHRVLWGGRSFHVGGFGVVMDMRSAHSMGGRPERAVVKAILAQVARFYGVPSGAGGGLTDAKEPSAQAGMQKAMISVAALLSSGSVVLDVGLLSLDEVCSPEQMIYDVELASAIRRMVRPVEISPETCAVEDIKEVGPGGNFLGSELTAERFRQELWEPQVWDRQSLQGWRASGARAERERVKERIRALLSAPFEDPRMTPECEQDLRAIIGRAVAAGAAV